MPCLNKLSAAQDTSWVCCETESAAAQKLIDLPQGVARMAALYQVAQTALDGGKGRMIGMVGLNRFTKPRRIAMASHLISFLNMVRPIFRAMTVTIRTDPNNRSADEPSFVSGRESA